MSNDLLIGTVYALKDKRVVVVENLFVQVDPISLRKSTPMIRLRFLDKGAENIPLADIADVNIETFSSMLEAHYGTPDLVKDTVLTMKYRVMYLESLKNNPLANGSWVEYNE